MIEIVAAIALLCLTITLTGYGIEILMAGIPWPNGTEVVVFGERARIIGHKRERSYYVYGLLYEDGRVDSYSQMNVTPIGK